MSEPGTSGAARIPRDTWQGARAIPAVCLAGLLTSVWFVDSYPILYCFFFLICGCLFVSVGKQLKFFTCYMSLYLLVGLLNISHWRGYVAPETLKLYIIFMMAFCLPFMLVAKDKTSLKIVYRGLNQIFFNFLLLHLIIVYLAVAYIYVTKGNVFLHQSLRYTISPSLSYVVKSSLPLTALAPVIQTRLLKQFFLVGLTVLPAILIGSRGTAIVAVFAFILVRLYAGMDLSRRRTLIRNWVFGSLGVLILAMVAVSFYIRRASGLAEPAQAIIRAYFDYDGWWVYMILPFYLALREVVGLTNQIIIHGLHNTANPHPLFFADLYTVLPGKSMAGGQSLGGVIGTVDQGGLTPGLLGGLYIDYRIYSFIFVLILGAILTWLLWKARKKPFYTPIYVVALTQVMHLFHRGFLKPEYFTSVFIAAFYAFVAGWEKAPASPPHSKGPLPPDGIKKSRSVLGKNLKIYLGRLNPWKK